ncbi:hypothetical protein GCM10009546_29810 [Actinomadura livida]|uniref:Uncharacterized protein n=1 Tax=Actinomadura livida TaxID=79909 RepID=A0ABN1EGE9_9ACTN|nr:hypothetical protein GCM10010208_33370 [Actinomadura livida]
MGGIGASKSRYKFFAPRLSTLDRRRGPAARAGSRRPSLDDIDWPGDTDRLNDEVRGHINTTEPLDRGRWATTADRRIPSSEAANPAVAPVSAGSAAASPHPEQCCDAHLPQQLKTITGLTLAAASNSLCFTALKCFLRLYIAHNRALP